MNPNGLGIDREKRILDYERKMNYKIMNEYLNILTERYSNISVSSIGTSVLGNSIPVISIGSGKKEVFYIGGIHGCDYITSSMLLRFINEYCELRKNNRRFYNLNLWSLEQTRKIHVIPMLNPDGVSYATEGVMDDNPLKERLLLMNKGSNNYNNWRGNARGVDLNMNLNVDFIDDNKRVGGLVSEAGLHPESEPESRALCSYVRYNENIRLMLNFRCGRECISYIDDNSIHRSKGIAQSLSRISGKPLSPATTDEVRGSFTGWCGKVMHIPSYTVLCENKEHGAEGCFQKYAGVRELLFTAPIMI